MDNLTHPLSILVNDTNTALYSLHTASHAHAVSLDLHNRTMALIIDHTLPALVDTAIGNVQTTMAELTNNVSSAIARRYVDDHILPSLASLQYLSNYPVL